jgi:hypothetical protein
VGLFLDLLSRSAELESTQPAAVQAAERSN